MKVSQAIKYQEQIERNYQMFEKAIGILLARNPGSEEENTYFYNKAKAELYNIDWFEQKIEDRKEKVEQLYNSNLTIVQIAKIYNVSKWSVQRFMKKHGIATRSPKKKVDLDKEEVVRLYGEGLSQKAVGLKFGVTESVISKFMRLNNIKARKKGGSKKRVFNDPK